MWKHSKVSNIQNLELLSLNSDDVKSFTVGWETESIRVQINSETHRNRKDFYKSGLHSGQLLALPPHPAGSFLCGVCKFSLRLCGFCRGALAFSHSPEAYTFSWLVIVKWLQWDCVLVGRPKVEQVNYKSESWCPSLPDKLSWAPSCSLVDPSMCKGLLESTHVEEVACMNGWIRQ